MPKPVKAEDIRFLDANEAWVAKVLDQAKRSEGLQRPGPAIEAAGLIAATLEGGRRWRTLMGPHSASCELAD